MPTSAILGPGPNGLSAGIVLAAAGLAPTVFERNARIGGTCSTAETTLPNFRQDLGSSAYPLGVASPFFRSLPIECSVAQIKCGMRPSAGLCGLS
jgi:phytoene dehydrogenase-like protein